MGQEQKKYHVTDNGDIYKVNDDGSFTAMGNAEDRQRVQPSPGSSIMPPPPPSTAPIANKPKANNIPLALIVGGILLALWALAALALFAGFL